MKHLLLYLLVLIILFGSSCLKTDTPVVTAPVYPSGTFSGQFAMIHRSNDHFPFDTVKSNITLTMTTPANTFSVGGDTTYLAGSYGTFSANGSNMGFIDKTYPATGTPKKTHLIGNYLYYYDGTNFQLLAYSADTLSIQYNLKKN